jgi:hypothetical protein
MRLWDYLHSARIRDRGRGAGSRGPQNPVKVEQRWMERPVAWSSIADASGPNSARGNGRRTRAVSKLTASRSKTDDRGRNRE